MITYNYFGKEQKIFYEKASNGLPIYYIPNKKSFGYQIELVVKYGSEIDEFNYQNKKIKIPAGTAHYLEHKMFDLQEGNVFSYLSDLGIYSNAATNYIMTKYYISGNKNLKKGLDFFLNMVLTPYFTEQTILNERGIIEEEIKMYDDEPEWILDYESKKAVYKNLYQEKIAGSIDSIKKIDKDLLTSIYNVFYQPKNMFLIISGSFDIKIVKNILNKNKLFNKLKDRYPIIYSKKEEIKDIVCEYKRIYGNIIIPKISYSFKISLDDFKIKDYRKIRLYLTFIFTYILDLGSDLNERIIEDKIATIFDVSHSCIDNIYVLSIESESEYADILKNEVDKALENISINEEDFERIRKIYLSLYIRSLDSKEALCNTLIDELIKDDKVTDMYKLIIELNYKDLLKVIDQLDLSQNSFIIMTPNNS